jgi:hypothetical protein
VRNTCNQTTLPKQQQQQQQKMLLVADFAYSPEGCCNDGQLPSIAIAPGCTQLERDSQEGLGAPLPRLRGNTVRSVHD